MPATPKRKTRPEPKGAATTEAGLLRFLYRRFVTADKKVKGAVGVGLIGALGWGALHAPEGLRLADDRLFRYPVELTYVRQGETKTGYVFELKIKSTDGSTVFIPRADLDVKIVRDERLVDAMPSEARKGLLYGETAKVLDNVRTLDAAVDGRTYTSDRTISSTSQPRSLFLLVTVAGPGSANPSSRLQLSPIYRSLVVSVRRHRRSSDYAEIPIRHISIVAGDDKTQVIQK